MGPVGKVNNRRELEPEAAEFLACYFRPVRSTLSNQPARLPQRGRFEPDV
jgi:hypothetical protein